MKIYAKRKDIEGFNRRAKSHFPNEHIEALWGRCAVGEFHIMRFHRMRITKKSPGEIEYTDDEVQRQKFLARTKDMEFLGTIHTHPKKYFDVAPSQGDHLEALRDGERVMGICKLFKSPNGRFTVETEYWQPQKPLKIEIIPE